MSPTEISLIILTAVLGAATVFGTAAMFTVGYFKKHKGGTEAFVLLLFVLTVIFAACSAAVHYGLAARDVAASAVLGACGGLAVIAILMIAGATTLKRQAKMSVLTGTVVLIVLLLQVAVNIAYPFDFDSGEQLTGGVVFARIISGTFQYFSLDAAYADIIRIGATALPQGGVYVFYILACSMTVIAPIVGGFAIFGVLGHFFPRLSLWINSRPTKYVFSELNEYSIETAESIVELKNKLATSRAERERYIDRYGKELYGEVMRSVIVFTDVYSDKKQETSAELLQRANNINAICLKDDILTRKIYWIGGRLYRLLTHSQKKVVYFLMDKADFYVEQGEENNLRTAVELFTTDPKRMVWEKTNRLQAGMKAQAVEIYVFSRNENADAIIKDAHGKWKEQYDGQQTVAYKTINEYQSLVYGLIGGAFPLYMGLERPYKSGNYNTEKLSVLIVGGGRIAKTFWKTAYRCGQMLCGKTPTKLRITTLSLDASETESKLKFDMPAVFDPKICNYTANKESYCEYKFIPATYGTEQFASTFRDIATGKTWGEKGDGIDVDYILVALGADNLNVQAADYIKRELHKLGVPDGKVIPINYVIENSALSSSIGGDSSDADKVSVCVLNPFGSLQERFSFDNISMTELERRALLANMAYSGDRGKRSFGVDAYSRDSSIATAMHSLYKTVCIDVEDKDYARRAFWLEHRRWTAYTRSIGYRNYTAAEFARMLKFKDKDGYRNILTKDTDLKLHACVTECSDRQTATSELQQYLDDHPEFFDIMFAALDDLKAGKPVCLKSGAAVVTMDDLFAYLRERSDDRFDNLDILSLMASRKKTDDKTAGKLFKAANYKPYDLDIVKRLHFDIMCDRIVERMFEPKRGDISDPLGQIVALYRNEFPLGTGDARCENNPAVACCSDNMFAFIGRRRGYDIIMWQTNGQGVAESERRLVSPKSFIIKASGGNYAIAAIPQGGAVRLIGENGKAYIAGVTPDGIFAPTLHSVSK